MTAIFLIVILAALAGFAARIFSVQQQSSGLDVQGSQAYAAAQSGIDWGAYQILTAAPGVACPADINLVMPAGPLSAFTATVTCTLSSHTEAGNTVTMYRITSTACNQPTGAGVCPNTLTPGDSYVERQVTATVEN